MPLTSYYDGKYLDASLPVTVDRWIAASMLQKSIRRGDVELAGRAAVTLHRMVGSTIWRRFVVIALEDVGAGCEGALKFAAHVAERRSRCRGLRDERAVQYLARKLAGLPKDRTADHLVSVALHHPSVASTRLRLHRAPANDCIPILLGVTAPLAVRATAALMLSTRDVDSVRRFNSGGFGELIAAYRRVGTSTSLLKTTERAGRATRDAIAIFAPMIHEAAFANGRPEIQETATPPTHAVHGVPTYALDKHTALGKAAIGRFVAENRQMQAVLAAFVPRGQWTIAAATAAFHADAAPVTKKLVWLGSDELERLGAEADLFRDGVPRDGARPVIECVRANVDHLNEIRVRLLKSRLDRS